MSATRLLAVADGLLRCIQSAAGLDACVSMYLIPVGSEASRSPTVFTQFELLEAMDLLRRLDMMPAPAPASRRRFEVS